MYFQPLTGHGSRLIFAPFSLRFCYELRDEYLAARRLILCVVKLSGHCKKMEGKENHSTRIVSNNSQGDGVQFVRRRIASSVSSLF